MAVSWRAWTLVIASLLASSASRADEDREVARIRHHLEGAEAILALRDLSTLSWEQRAARARNVAVLRAYRQRGEFPHNTDFPLRQVPYFVDRAGVRCAMAHLIEQSGGADLVARVASSANHAWVADLAADPDFIVWLDRNGLTVAEAARIQPSYCYLRADCICGSEPMATAEVLVGDYTPSGARQVRADRVAGDPRLGWAAGSWYAVNIGFAENLESAVRGQRALLLFDWAYAPPDHSRAPDPSLVPLDGCGRTLCRLGGNYPWPDDLHATADEASSAFLSSDCAAALAADDPRWGRRQCNADADGGVDRRCAMPIDAGAFDGPPPDAMRALDARRPDAGRAAPDSATEGLDARMSAPDSDSHMTDAGDRDAGSGAAASPSRSRGCAAGATVDLPVAGLFAMLFGAATLLRRKTALRGHGEDLRNRSVE